MLAISSLFLALAFTQAVPAAEQTGRLSGRVTVEGSNAPVGGTRIVLMPAGRPAGPIGMPPQTITDQDGRYVFERLAAGAYRVAGDKTGYAPTGDMTRMPTVQVVAGVAITFDLHLQKGAVIAGRIVDARGEPVTDALILVLRRVTPGSGASAFRAMPRLLPAGGQSHQTNDLGDYRVAGLAAGEYFVAVMPRPIGIFGGPGVSATSAPAPEHHARTTLATTYYPGVADDAAAQPIAVAAGAEVGNINFAIQSVPAFRVSGQVVDEDGHPVPNVMISLIGEPRNGVMFGGPPAMTRTRDNGRFDIDDIVAGTYRARIAGGAIAGIPVGAAAGGAVFSGRGGSGNFVTWSANNSSPGLVDPDVEVGVTDADVTGVRIVARRPARQ